MNLDTGLLLVVSRPADWPWGPKARVSGTEDRLLLVGTKRRGPKQPIKPLPEDLCDDAVVRPTFRASCCTKGLF
jgi:hypothetical protein